jgi:hypothetical protein
MKGDKVNANSGGTKVMNGTQNLNIDIKTLEMCLKSVTSYGHTTYMNICTGAQTVVPWGCGDWAMAIFLTTLGASVIIVELLGGLAIVRDF